MRLGELSEDQQARGHEERHSPTWIWPILSLVFATSGLGALLVKSTPVICTSTGERACIIERIADADWLMPIWTQVDADSYGIAPPAISIAHEVDLSRQETSLSVQGKTSDGLSVHVRNMTVSHHVGLVDALDVLQSGGGSIPERNDLVNDITVATTRYVIAQMRIEQLVGGRPADTVKTELIGPLGTLLARVGIELRSLHLYGVETDSDVGRVVERIRAARTRTTTAQNALLELQKRHRKALKTIETDRAARLTNLESEFAPRLKVAETALHERTQDANSAFRKRRKFAELKREVDQIRLEALRSASRHKHDALETRVKALANAGTELLDLEIAERVMGGVGQEEATSSSGRLQMKLAVIIASCLIGLLGTSLSLALHPVSRLETVSDQAGPFYERSLLWQRAPISPTPVRHAGLSKDAPNRGLLITRLDENTTHPAEKEWFTTSVKRAIWNLDNSAYRLAIRPAEPTLDGRAAIEALQKRAQRTEREAKETESQVPELETRHADALAVAHEETLRAIDAETRRLKQALDDLDFQGTRFEAIRSAEAEAIEIRLSAEADLELARLQAESDRIRAQMLGQPGGHLYTALEANRQFDVRRIELAPTSPDLIRYFGGIALWRDFFSRSGATRSKQSSDRPTSR